MMHHLRFVYIIRFLIYLLQEPLDNHVIRLLEMEAYISTRSFFLRSHSLSDSWSKQQPRGDQDCSSQRTHECWTFGATGVHKPFVFRVVGTISMRLGEFLMWDMDSRSTPTHCLDKKSSNIYSINAWNGWNGHIKHIAYDAG